VAKGDPDEGSARYTTGIMFGRRSSRDVLRQGMAVQTSTDDGSYVDLALGDGTATVLHPVVFISLHRQLDGGPAVTFQRTAEQNVGAGVVR